MSARHVVVDGSNIATEGRSLPNLAQLDEAVREFLAENPDDLVTVVVDASFGHRVDPSELPTFEEAEAAGEIVSPPAGAIGRGDAFLLRIAEKIGATVLSNDSFQEFHGEHAWLFDKGRLIGGKPVPGVGWIFMERSPVRGQKSREVVKEAKRKKKAEAVEEAPSGLDLAASRTKVRDKKVDRAIARATQEVIQPKEGKHSKRRRSGTPPAEPVNEPLPFITFIAAHPLGSEVTGIVSEFASHGAFVESFGAKCYIPLSAMGNPPPRRAREVLSKGEERTFVVQALDPLRRGIELALPGFERIAGSPTPETVDAEIHPAAASKPGRKKAADARGAAGVQTEPPIADGEAPPGKAAAKKAVAKKAPGEKTAVKKAAAKTAPAKKAAGKKAPAKKAAATKAPAKELSGVKESSATEVAGKKVAGKKAGAAVEVGKKAGAAGKATKAEKATRKAGAAEKRTKKAGAPKKAAQIAAPAEAVEKVGSPTKRPAKKAPSKKAPAKKAAARKAPAPATAPATKAPNPAKAPNPTKAARPGKPPPAKETAPADNTLPEPYPDQGPAGQTPAEQADTGQE